VAKASACLNNRRYAHWDLHFPRPRRRTPERMRRTFISARNVAVWILSRSIRRHGCRCQCLRGSGPLEPEISAPSPNVLSVT
jgi:hypothetical protein